MVFWRNNLAVDNPVVAYMNDLGPIKLSFVAIGICLAGGCGGESGAVMIPLAPVVSNQTPTASISSPSAGSTFMAGEPVVFEGAGSDPEDGPLTGASLVWSSAVDGQIGTGGSFVISTLSPTTHTITLTATDSGGRSGTATVQINVLPTVNSLTVTPGFAVLDVSGVGTLSVDAFDNQGNSIASPQLQVVSRNPTVSSAAGLVVSGVATGVTDVVVTSGMGADSTRIAVVDENGFAVLLSTTPNDAVIQTASGSTVRLNILMVRPPAGAGVLGSIQGSLQWDPARLSYESSAVVEAGWSWFPNETGVGAGQFSFSAFSVTGTAATFSVAEVVLSVNGAAGSAPAILALTIDVAGNDAGTDISALIQSVSSAVEIQ